MMTVPEEGRCWAADWQHRTPAAVDRSPPQLDRCYDVSFRLPHRDWLFADVWNITCTHHWHTCSPHRCSTEWYNNKKIINSNNNNNSNAHNDIYSASGYGAKPYARVYSEDPKWTLAYGAKLYAKDSLSVLRAKVGQRLHMLETEPVAL